MYRLVIILLTLIATSVGVMPDRAAAAVACTIVGTPGQDVLHGTSGDDVICGMGGSDVIDGGAGNDVLRGGSGRDALYGQGGADHLVAGDGTGDVLRGGPGWDHLDARDDGPSDLIRGGGGRNLCVADAEDHRSGCDHRLVPADATAVPILMYHVIARRPAGAPFPELYVPRAVFAAQMRTLATNGYHVVTLQEVYDHWHGAPLPRRPVVVSFDDGFRNQYTHALPILSAYGWAGTLNLAVTHLHEGSYGLGPRQVAAMINAGWEIDSHTMTHAHLPSLGAATLWREVAGSRSYLHATFHVPIHSFCYPYGAYSTSVVAAVRRAGYLLATTTEPGLATPAAAFTLPRVRVTAQTSLTNVAKLIRPRVASRAKGRLDG